MKAFIEMIEAWLKEKFHAEITNGGCYVSPTNWGSSRNSQAPLWVNCVVDSEILACDICNSPETNEETLDVSFFWRKANGTPNTNTFSIDVKRDEDEVTRYAAYWSDQIKPFPKGFSLRKSGPHDEFYRYGKTYNIRHVDALDVAREIAEVYRFFGVK